MDEFKILKKRFKTHKRAAAYLGISYSRYCAWRWHPECMPKYAQKLIELAVEHENTAQAN